MGYFDEKLRACREKHPPTEPFRLTPRDEAILDRVWAELEAEGALDNIDEEFERDHGIPLGA